MLKELPANAGDMGDADLIPGSGGYPGVRMEPTLVFLSRKSRGQKSLAGDSP